MTQISVPIINENPDSITPVFQSEYAISVEAANPYLLVDGLGSGTTPTLAQAVAACQPGGPGWLGGPECVTLLQRTASYSANPTTGFAYETFTLPQYPDHTFYTFNNYVTGKKNVVCFSNSGAPVPTDIVPVITAHAYATATDTGLVTTATLVAGGTYAWGLTGGTITAGQGTNAITWTAGSVGTATFTCTYTNAAGIAAPACTPATTTIVTLPTIATITASGGASGASLTASVPAQATCTYAWTVSNGTITAGQGTVSITYTAGSAGPNLINCNITNLAGSTTAATQKSVTIT